MLLASPPAPASARRAPRSRSAMIRVLVPSSAACIANRFSATFEVVVQGDARDLDSPLWFPCSERRIVRADALLMVEASAFHDDRLVALEVRAPRAATRADITRFEVLAILGHQRPDIEAAHGPGADPDLRGPGTHWTRHRAGLAVQYRGELSIAVRVPVSGDIPRGRLDAWLGLTEETAAGVTITRVGPYAEVRPR